MSNPISAMVDSAREASVEALGREDSGFMLRWLAAVALTAVKGVSPGYLRLKPVEQPEALRRGRKGGL